MSRVAWILASLLVSPAAIAQVGVSSDGSGGVTVDTGTGTKVKAGGARKSDVEVTSEGAKTTVRNDGKAIESGNRKGSVTVKSSGTQVDAEPDSAPPATSSAGSEFTLTDNGKLLEHTCLEGEHFGVMGNRNVITLHGPCKKLSVVGNQNNLTIDVVGAIDAMGNQNNIAWRAALKGRAPKVDAVGSANSISQQK